MRVANLIDSSTDGEYASVRLSRLITAALAFASFRACTARLAHQCTSLPWYVC
jgi:hypothetical protein